MPFRNRWFRVAANSIDRRHGRVIKVYRHPACAGALLLHVKLLSRTAAWHRRTGLWAVLVGDVPVAMRAYWDREIKAPPLAWATRELRKHAA
jgi:hypothetical protein